MDIGAGGNDKDTWKRIGTHAADFSIVLFRSDCMLVSEGHPHENA
jgi:hypothetical protein